jgi:hypothetical protein
MMSLDELNKLLPEVDTTDTDDVLLPTHTWLSYHTSIQGYNFVSNSQAKPLSNLGHTAKQAKHDYEVLQP